MVKWMIKHEADVTRKDRSKRTALHAAVEKKQYSVSAIVNGKNWFVEKISQETSLWW